MFTFKTEQPTGRWRSFDVPIHYIKLKKKVVGTIEPTPPHKIHLMVIKDDTMEDGNKNCDWKWITLKREFVSVDEAKAFLKEYEQKIIEKYKLKMLDN